MGLVEEKVADCFAKGGAARFAHFEDGMAGVGKGAGKTVDEGGFTRPFSPFECDESSLFQGVVAGGVGGTSVRGTASSASTASIFCAPTT